MPISSLAAAFASSWIRKTGEKSRASIPLPRLLYCTPILQLYEISLITLSAVPGIQSELRDRSFKLTMSFDIWIKKLQS